MKLICFAPMTFPNLLNCLFFALIALASSLTHAQNESLQSLLATSQQDEFLPVEKAYQVDIQVTDEALTLNWTIEPAYYLYRSKFEFTSKTAESTTKLKGQLQRGLRKFDENLDKEVETYYNATQIVVPLDETLPERFELKLKSQGCADAGLCYAPRTQYFQIDRHFKTAVESDSSQFTQSDSKPTTTTTAPVKPRGAEFSLFVYILFALGGGLILNLMPCVFPVLSLKALTFASTSGSAHSHHMHGWAYTAGVVLSFSLAALVILTARAAGESADWGFQLQQPMFVAIMLYLFLTMGLSLSGLIHFGSGLMGLGQGLTANEGLRGSFFTGVLAVIVASPCTGPLMAPAIGFALTQPSVVALTIFIALGFGMALPFLLLSYSPKLAKLLPRPGLWMEKLKEFLAFPMYLTAIWLLYVFGRQVGIFGATMLISGAVAIAFAIWLFQSLPEQKPWRKVIQAMGLASLLYAAYIAYTGDGFSDDNGDWQPFSRELVQNLRDEGKTVFVDFTADWCITCKVNKGVALSGASFSKAVADYNVALVKADWTNEDPIISAVLKEYGRSGVPMYLVFHADSRKEAEMLPQFLTRGIVLEAFQRAASAKVVMSQ